MVSKDSQIIIKNLSSNVNDELLRETFEKYGNIVDVAISGDMAMIEYDRAANAIDALTHEDKKLLQGRPMEIQMLTDDPTDDPPVDRHLEMGAAHPTNVGRRTDIVAPDENDDNDDWATEWRQRNYLHAPPDGRRYGGATGGRQRTYRDRSPIGGARAPRDVNPMPAPREQRGRVEGNTVYTTEPPERVNELEIITVNMAQRAYAEMIEGKLLELKLRVDMFFAKPSIPLAEMLDKIASVGTPFVMVVDTNNDKRETVSLYKLQTDPKEWKNIPLKEAISIVLIGLAPAEPLPPAHPNFVYRSLYRMSDNRVLTAMEYTRLLNYLADERDKAFERMTESRLAGEVVRNAVRELNQGGSHQAELEERIITIVNSYRNSIGSDATFDETIQELLGTQ